MVNPISSTDARAKLQKINNETAADRTRALGKSDAAQAAAATDEVTLSQEAKLRPGGTEVGPPFDLELVSKIKKAISEGNYPIDYESITDSLFESYKDLML